MVDGRYLNPASIVPCVKPPIFPFAHTMSTSSSHEDSDFARLRTQLSDPSEHVETVFGREVRQARRGEAALALAKYKDSRVVPSIAALLGDAVSKVRTEAAIALGRLGDVSAVSSLEDALEDDDPNVRGCAARSLGQIGEPSAASALFPVLQDENRRIRLLVGRVLARLGDRAAVGPIWQALRRERFRHWVTKARLGVNLLTLMLRSAKQ